MHKRLLTLSLLFVCLTGCTQTSQNTFDISKYSVTETTINDTTIRLAIADTLTLQAYGFMDIQNIPNNQGMLFLYPQEQPRSFWMKNTYVPLDIIFLDQDKKVINIRHNTPPCIESDPTQTQCPSYKSTSPAQFVIELPSPQAKNLNLQPDQTIHFNIPQNLTELQN